MVLFGFLDFLLQNSVFLLRQFHLLLLGLELELKSRKFLVEGFGGMFGLGLFLADG
jgi:hypothetical protein